MGTGSGGFARAPLLAVLCVLAIAALGAWYLLGDDLRLGPGRGRSVVTLGISLVPDATGTLVEIVGESSDGSLPPAVDLELVTTDDAALVDAGPATGARLRYSDVRDGLGNLMPADAVRSGRLPGVGTDGRRVRLSFHVEKVDGRRIVYPIPRSPQLGWVRARLYVSGATVTCWGDAPSGRSAFGPCHDPTGTDADGTDVDGTRHAGIRLELTR